VIGRTDNRVYLAPVDDAPREARMTLQRESNVAVMDVMDFNDDPQIVIIDG